MTAEQIAQSRRKKDQFFKASAQSPLDDVQKSAFTSLNYFDFNPELVLEVLPERFSDDDTAQVITTQNTIRNYQRYGRFTFVVDGQPVALTIYKTPHGYFLPFVDASGETYPAGRYLDLAEPRADGIFDVDFNQAYNPYCAYSDRYDCPITPQENRLTVPIHAGEKLFSVESD